MRLQSFVLILRVKTCISINIKTPCNLIPDWFDCWLLPSTYETRSSLKLLFYSNSYLFTKVAARVRVSTSVISKSSSKIKSVWGTYFLSQKKIQEKLGWDYQTLTLSFTWKINVFQLWFTSLFWTQLATLSIKCVIQFVLWYLWI